jgi:hypothetical protein
MFVDYGKKIYVQEYPEFILALNDVPRAQPWG